jgi:hypothetical protein
LRVDLGECLSKQALPEVFFLLRRNVRTEKDYSESATVLLQRRSLHEERKAKIVGQTIGWLIAQKLHKGLDLPMVRQSVVTVVPAGPAQELQRTCLVGAQNI